MPTMLPLCEPLEPLSPSGPNGVQALAIEKHKIAQSARNKNLIFLNIHFLLFAYVYFLNYSIYFYKKIALYKKNLKKSEKAYAFTKRTRAHESMQNGKYYMGIKATVFIKG